MPGVVLAVSLLFGSGTSDGRDAILEFFSFSFFGIVYGLRLSMGRFSGNCLPNKKKTFFLFFDFLSLVFDTEVAKGSEGDRARSGAPIAIQCTRAVQCCAQEGQGLRSVSC